jgi:putative hydrolase of the HAD superfamily
MTVRAITFDLWRTLLRDDNSENRRRMRFEAFSRVTGVAVDEMWSAWDVALQEWARRHRDEQRTLHAHDFIALLEEVFGVKVSPESMPAVIETFQTAVLEQPPEAVDGAGEALEAAAARFPLGLISDTGNSPGQVLRQLLERYGFLKYFTVTVFSDEEGTCKPRREIFEAAARGLDVDLSELLHIGDLEFSDIAGAQAGGAKAALFAGVNDRFLHSTRADYVFTSWRDFLDLLPSL